MARTPKILILNGPNLNLLGTRQPSVYGRETLGDVERACTKTAETLGLEVDFRQSNREGELVDWIQEARDSHAGIVINAGAYSHTSVAILDALLAVDLPVIEVHLSNLFKRETFRHHSYISQAAQGVICGLGAAGYLYALDALGRRLSAQGEA
ncbi:type II 3-dehydroquinate dehydratase [Rhodovibrio salinarum]|uniref:3-dehydroquinate dehydratase n=1 Tax=Rhodovibrio salinarum TaxID=1087 RepID=A0A934UYX9_9PROT|nr:type II 3-dehydroquinate dehydratase [Rhodovibrio salinarum]MBK1695891.1 type II 3-dehydroquinate dehydratase [Rhodovibrio salinarum]